MWTDLLPGRKHRLSDFRDLPSELMSAKFSSITSRYRLLCAKLRSPHSFWENRRATSSNTTELCSDGFG